MVPPPGLEPGRHQARHFKCRASTNFAKGAPRSPMERPGADAQGGSAYMLCAHRRTGVCCAIVARRACRHATTERHPAPACKPESRVDPFEHHIAVASHRTLRGKCNWPIRICAGGQAAFGCVGRWRIDWPISLEIDPVAGVERSFPALFRHIPRTGEKPDDDIADGWGLALALLYREWRGAGGGRRLQDRGRLRRSGGRIATVGGGSRDPAQKQDFIAAAPDPELIGVGKNGPQ